MHNRLLSFSIALAAIALPLSVSAAESVSVTLTEPDALPAKAGDTATWTVNLFNDGSSAATGYVTFRIGEPAEGKTFLAWQPSAGCEKIGDYTIKCGFTNMAAGTAKYVPITMKRGPTCSTRSYFLYASTTVTSPTTYTLMTVGSDYDETGCPSADTSVELTGPKEYAPGDTIGLKLRLKNTGPSATKGTSVKLFVPSGSTWVKDGSSADISCVGSGSFTFQCAVADLAKGSDKTFDVKFSMRQHDIDDCRRTQSVTANAYLMSDGTYDPTPPTTPYEARMYVVCPKGVKGAYKAPVAPAATTKAAGVPTLKITGAKSMQADKETAITLTLTNGTSSKMPKASVHFITPSELYETMKPKDCTSMDSKIYTCTANNLDPKKKKTWKFTVSVPPTSCNGAKLTLTASSEGAEPATLETKCPKPAASKK